MPASTDSPTVLRDALNMRFGRTPLPGQEWTTLAELLAYIMKITTKLLPIAAYYRSLRSLRSLRSTTGDEGALLGEVAESDNPYQALFPSLFQELDGYLGDASAPPMALGPARIVESNIIQPHLAALRWIKEATGYSQDRIADLVGVTRQTLNRWDRGEAIKDTNRQRIFAVREILERAWVRHTTRTQLTAWLDTPRGADGRTPAQCLAVGDIGRARLLAVSVPSPRLSLPPAWVRRPVPASFQVGAEHEQEALPPEEGRDSADEETP